jgi:hypothetical protein
MKNFVVLMSFCFSICVLASSCTKTSTPTTVIGFWVGTYQVTGSAATYYVSFDLRPDSVFLYRGLGADGNYYYGQGNYTVKGATFADTFTTLNLSQAGAIQNGTGIYTAATSTITGNWQNQGLSINGTFTVKKSQ